MTGPRKYDPWLPGAVKTDDGLQFEPTLLIHADEAFLLRPAIEQFMDELTRMGASAKADRLANVVARWRYLADFHATRLAQACADKSDDSTPPSRHGSSRHDDDWIDTAAAGQLLDVTPARVRQLLATELEGRQLGRVWLVSRSSVLDYRGRAA